jgi:hypothetical protein
MQPAGIVITALLGMLLLTSCEETPGDTIFDPNYQGNPDPVISSITPENGWLSGVSGVTITGENFSTVPSENLVYFGSARATVQSASQTSLEVVPPLVQGETLPVRVSVLGAERFSNTWDYQLTFVVNPVAGLSDTDDPFGVTTDGEGNIYFSNVASNTPTGIMKLSPDGTLTNHSPARSWRYQSIKYGPDGGIYMIRGGVVPFVYKVPPGGGQDATWATGLGRMNDIDFDENGYLWAAGANEGLAAPFLFRIAQDGSHERYPFDATVRAVRVYDGYVWVGASMGGEVGIWKFPINPDNSAGDPAMFYSFGMVDFQITALTFATSGAAIVGTNGDMPMIRVNPQGTGSEEIFPGVFPPRPFAFAYNELSDDFLVVFEAASVGGVDYDQILARVTLTEDLEPYNGPE